MFTLAQQREKARKEEGEGDTHPPPQPTAGATRKEEILGFGVTRKDIEQAERMELDR
jgi:hypothetical protein